MPRNRKTFCRFCCALISIMLFASGLPRNASAQACAPFCRVYLPVTSALPPPPLQVTALGTIGTRGGFVIDGDIETVGNDPVYDAVLLVQWFDPIGRYLGTTPGYIRFPAIFPGHKNHFSSLIMNTSADGGTQEFVFKSWRFQGDQAYAPLTVVDKQLKVFFINISETQLKVDALIRNDQARTVKNIQVAIWQLDLTESFHLISASPIPDGIAPGETFTVTQTLTDRCCGQNFQLAPVVVLPLNVEAQGILQP